MIEAKVYIAPAPRTVGSYEIQEIIVCAPPQGWTAGVKDGLRIMIKPGPLALAWSITAQEALDLAAALEMVTRRGLERVTTKEGVSSTS